MPADHSVLGALGVLVRAVAATNNIILKIVQIFFVGIPMLRCDLGKLTKAVVSASDVHSGPI